MSLMQDMDNDPWIISTADPLFFSSFLSFPWPLPYLCWIELRFTLSFIFHKTSSENYKLGQLHLFIASETCIEISKLALSLKPSLWPIVPSEPTWTARPFLLVLLFEINRWIRDESSEFHYLTFISRRVKRLGTCHPSWTRGFVFHVIKWLKRDWLEFLVAQVCPVRVAVN